MKRLRNLFLSAMLLIGISVFLVVTPHAMAGDVIIHLGGEVVAPAPAPAPAPVYAYVYYPDEEVYFVPDQQVYWWRVGGEWRSGPHVPEAFHLGASVNLRVDGRDPWRHHDVIVRHYPHHDRH